MSEEKGLLPKLEIIIVGVLFLVFLIWSISKCSATRKAYSKQAAEEQAEQNRLDSLDKAKAQEALAGLDTSIQPLKKPAPPSDQPRERLTPLYVITPALNLRSGPGLKFTVLERYNLHDELQFLGEVTDTTQRIDLGDIVTDEPWVKVKSPKGTEGWVYGACVDFYKRELKGVEAD
ncbi:MAG: SH3 domain-containing protein [Bacteroidetes bacterium]|jgi:hypothetical protein|nr:SH3 domain-containing protein [Bacteroidota bacterium]